MDASAFDTLFRALDAATESATTTIGELEAQLRTARGPA